MQTICTLQNRQGKGIGVTGAPERLYTASDSRVALGSQIPSGKPYGVTRDDQDSDRSGGQVE